MNACPGWERLVASEAWSAAERDHVERCPRCAAFLAEYRAFDMGDAQIPPAERADAGVRLSRFISEQVGSPVPRVDARRGDGSAGVLERVIAWLATPPARWASGLAALAVVAGVLFVPHAPPLRVGEAQRGVSAAGFAVSVSRANDGVVRLAWPSVPHAGGYRVEVLAADLTVLECLDAGAAQEWHLDPAALPAGAFVRIVALHLGDRLAETAPMAVPAR